MTKAVAYFRVSTAGQGRSGLGLEAQRRAVEELARRRAFSILAQFTEVESGKRNDRPQLAAALQHARLTGATLVIAKLDRLSRNASFLLALRDSGVRFIAADIPDANDLTIGVLAVVAQAEREATAVRTREALAVVKAKLENGEEHLSRSGRQLDRLGNPNGASVLRAGQRRGVGADAAKAAASKRAAHLTPAIAMARGAGCESASAIARELNRLGVVTPQGRRWHPSTVAGVLKRLAEQAAKAGT